MDESDLEPDPNRQMPTVLWLILGLTLMAAFAALVFLLFDHGPPHAIGPPPGAAPD
jgi:hypothetical protein